MSNGALPDARRPLAGVSAVAADTHGSAVGDLPPARVLLRVLGVFEASLDGQDVSLGGPRQRAVLARVLVGDGDAVSAEQIVEDVWGERAAGGSSASTVHVYISRLRRALGGEAILHRDGGYVLDRRLVAVDAEDFVADVVRGRRMLAKGDDEGAARVLEGALDRWVGPRVFGGLGDIPFLAIPTARLEELRVGAAETLADAHARRGRAAGDVALLEELAARDPLRESLALRLVTALYAAGRQADALAAFERCRRSLADQLGVDPAPPLRRVHAAVLAQEAPLVAAAVSLSPPVNLPPRNRSFTGRTTQLAAVDRLLDDDEHRPRAVALSGLPGIGKTELALEVAYRRRRAGRVAWWVGADDPARIAAGLADLAVAAGVPQFEREEDTRDALWVELDRNPGWVIVFDNATEPRVLEPFLPAAQHGDVIITSTNPAWRRLARPLALPPMARPESVAFAIARSGDRDAAGADELAELVGDLPLALEQACAYIEQTGMTVPDYVRLFRGRRADLLLRGGGGSRPTVTTTWGLAFDRLRARSELAATVLETAAFLAPDAIDLALLRPLADDELELQEAVGELLRLSLVDREGDRLRVHRLVQDVVRGRLSGPAVRGRFATAAALCDAPARGDDAGWTAWAAHLVVLAGHGADLALVPDRLVDSLSALARRYAARALYPAATQVLEAALRLARVPAAGPTVREGRLLCQLGEVCDAAGRLTEALRLHQDAVAMLAGLVGPHDVSLAHAYNRLGHVLNCADDVEGAIVAHRQALAALDAAGRADLHPPVLTDLGYTLWAAGQLEPAEAALRAGRAQLEEQGRRDGRDWAHATAGLGMVEQDNGRLAAAVEHQRTVIEVFTRVCGADHPDTAQALDKLGYVLRLQGRYDESMASHERAARLLERVLGPDDSRVGMALTNLGLACLDAGRADRAVAAQCRARTIFLGSLGGTHAHTLLAGRRLAVALAAAGQPDRARALLDEVLRIVAKRTGDGEVEQGRIAADAAAVYEAAGDSALAQRWRDRAEAILTRALGAGHPEVLGLTGLGH
ncbi:MAG TPA: tetratricopeptide repeat protein [Pseudonocardia sp.]|nr:tetratricopeptide repeat protein [Pseudonocardia sp.]